jgi:hypothetical protein
MKRKVRIIKMLQPYQYLVGKIADYVCPSISDGHFHFIKVLGNTLCVNETQIEYLDNGGTLEMNKKMVKILKRTFVPDERIYYGMTGYVLALDLFNNYGRVGVYLDRKSSTIVKSHNEKTHEEWEDARPMISLENLTIISSNSLKNE